MKILIPFLLLASISFANGPLPTAKFVDVSQYIGKWYAISALPQFFTRKCLGQTAEYGIKDSQSITVLNTCLKKKNKKKVIEGQSKIVNFNTNAELEVTFNNFWTKLFKVKGDYIIMDIDKDYQHVLIGSNNRKSMWIMSRTTSIPDTVYNKYLGIAKRNGFNISKLVKSRF